MTWRVGTEPLSRLTPVAIVGLVAAGLVAAAAGPTAPRSTTPADLTLANDSSGSAMFALHAMAPGETVRRCITVSSGPASVPVDVRLYGTASGPLAAALHLVVEAGHGGRFGSCAGFGGQVVYDGSLAAFAAGHSDFATGLAAWVPDGSGVSSYRFSVGLDATAEQGQTARARFVWESQPTGPGTVPPAPTAAPTAGPAGPAAPIGPAPTGTPTPAPATGWAGNGLPAGPATGGRTPDALSRFIDGLPAPLAPIAHVLAPILRQPGLPSLWLLLVVAFLVTQHQIDRRDPKLALAPVSADPHLDFPDTVRRPRP